jgi:hypothetical protein
MNMVVTQRSALVDMTSMNVLLSRAMKGQMNSLKGRLGLTINNLSKRTNTTRLYINRLLKNLDTNIINALLMKLQMERRND